MSITATAAELAGLAQPVEVEAAPMRAMPVGTVSPPASVSATWTMRFGSIEATCGSLVEVAHLGGRQLRAVALQRGPVHVARVDAVATLVLGELVRDARHRVVQHDDVAAGHDRGVAVPVRREGGTGKGHQAGDDGTGNCKGTNPHQSSTGVDQPKVASLGRFVASFG